MLHPQIVDSTMGMLNCKEFIYTDGAIQMPTVSLLVNDFGQHCWSEGSLHLNMGMPISITGIIVWDIGIILLLFLRLKHLK